MHKNEKILCSSVARSFSHLRVKMCKTLVFSATLYFFCSVIAVSLGAERCLQSENDLVRLSGLNSSFIGYVQTCKDGYWISISYQDDEWTKKNSIVVCRELHYQGAIRITVEQQSSSNSSQQYHSVECTGMEEHLADCIWTVKDTNTNFKDAIVLCSEAPSNGELLLVGSSEGDNVGLVKIYSETSGWTPVCARGWDNLDAQVACRQLGMVGGSSTQYRFNQDPWRHSKHLGHVECSGSETKLNDCKLSPAECDSDYAAIVCSTEATGSSIPILKVTILVLMIVISLLLIGILLLVLKCLISNFRYKSSSSSRRQVSRTVRRHTMDIRRIELDQDMPYYTSVATVAPPSYQDTLLADQTL